MVFRRTHSAIVAFLTSLLLSGFSAFGSSPASSYGLDFGARDYDHDGLAWLEPDPLAYKFPELTPYSYCADNPLKFVDPEGKSTRVIKLNNGKYQVSGVDVNDGDLNIYECSLDENGNGNEVVLNINNNVYLTY